MRIKYLDNLKFFLILLVIFGHTIEYSIFENYWLKSLYYFIYIFHMPLFIIISGYFFKENTLKKINIFSIKFLETFLICQFIFIAGDFFYKGKIENIFYPRWGLWYLLSIIFWKYLLYISKRFFKNDYLLLFISILISLGIGFFNFNGSIFSITRTIMFFPYFILGYLITPQYLDKIMKSRNYYFYIIIIVYLILCLSPYISEFNNFRFILYHNSPYSITSEANRIDLIVNVILMISVIILSFSLIKVLPPIKSFERLGRFTLFFYIYQLFILIILRYLMFDKLHLPNNFIILIFQYLIVVFILILMNKYELFHKLLNPITSFIKI